MRPYNGYDMYGNPIYQGNYMPEEGVMPYQQLIIPGGQFNPGFYQQPQRFNVTKKDILSYLQNYSGAIEMEQVSEFDTVKTRHICKGYKEIVLLDKQIIQVPTSNGFVGVEVFFCPRCRKLLINSQSLEVY